MGAPTWPEVHAQHRGSTAAGGAAWSGKDFGIWAVPSQHPQTGSKAIGGVWANRRQTAGIAEGLCLPNIQVSPLHEVFLVLVASLSNTAFLWHRASLGNCSLGSGVRGTFRIQ